MGVSSVSQPANRNFQKNRGKFVDGEDFYLVDFKGKDEFRFSLGLADPVNRITLLTESGYLLLCKSLTDDRAIRPLELERFLATTKIVVSNKSKIRS